MLCGFVKKYIAAVLALAVFAPACAVRAASDTVYAYDFEDSRLPTIDDGGAEFEIADSFSGNDGKSVKIDKKSVGSTAKKDNRVKVYPLGEGIDITGGTKYFELKFRLYTDGAGFESIAAANSAAAWLCAPIGIQGSGTDGVCALEAGRWNDVSVLFNITEQTIQPPFTVYKSTAEIKVNGTVAAAQSVTENIRQRTALENKFDIRLILTSAEGAAFTAYLDDLSLATYTASAPELAQSDRYTVSGDTVTVEEGTTVSALAADGCTVKVCRGDAVLAPADELAAGDRVIVENVVGARREYTVAVAPPSPPELISGSGYSVAGDKISLTGRVSARTLRARHTDSISAWADAMKTDALAADDALFAGCAVVLSRGDEQTEYKVTSDRDMLFYNDFDAGAPITFTNATVAVETEFEENVDGRAAGDKSLKVHANEKGGGNDPSCKAALISKADAAKKYYRVDFSILPNDEKFVGVSLAGGWTTRMTPQVKVGEDALVRDKWNRVTYILRLGDLYLDGSRYRLDVTSDVYVNGTLMAAGEKVTTYPTDPSKNEAVFPIFLRLNSTSAEEEYVTYVDDISVSSPADEPTLTVDFGGGRVLPADAAAVLTANYELAPGLADGLAIDGGAGLSAAQSRSSARVTMTGLGCGTVYELAADGICDIFGRSLPRVGAAFETVPKILVGGEFGFDKTEISAGKISATADGLANMCDTEQRATLIMLLFKDGKAADMRTAQTVIPAGAAQGEITCEMDIPNEPSAKFVLKCFLWDSAEKGVSYAPYITLGGR